MTPIFDPEDGYIHSDAVFGLKQSLMARFAHFNSETRIATKWGG